MKQTINDLIVRLMEEAASEADAKGWCDAELSTNEQTRKEKTDAVETLHAVVDQLGASIAKLANEADSTTPCARTTRSAWTLLAVRSVF